MDRPLYRWKKRVTPLFSPTNTSRRIMLDRILALPFSSTITRTLSVASQDPEIETGPHGLHLCDYRATRMSSGGSGHRHLPPGIV